MLPNIFPAVDQCITQLVFVWSEKYETQLSYFADYTFICISKDVSDCTSFLDVSLSSWKTNHRKE